MCAICGIKLISDRFSSEDAALLCKKMADTMPHRGPDADGFFLDPRQRVFLGHRRLSIIDLSPAGKQPLFNEDHTIAAMVNGEIYNYQEIRSQLVGRGHSFSSHCDVEVLTHLFEEKGATAWTNLRGMYAAAVYEMKSGVLHLARDPLGIKPLYLFESPDLIAFASEIRALTVLQSFTNDLDMGGIMDFLLLGSIPSPRTHFRNVYSLLPGETIQIHGNEIRHHGNSPVPGWCQEAAESKPKNIALLKDCIRESVAKHLMSDVPIGLFLSGGMDSGVLTGLATETSRLPVHTVSVTIPGHSLDESAYAQQTAKAFGTIHTEICLDQNSFEKDLPSFFDHLDLPSIDGLNTFIVSKAARKAGLTVALTGVGGDELFGGYSTFNFIPRFERTHQLARMGGRFGRNTAAIFLKLIRNDSGAARVAEALRFPRADVRMAYLACRGLFFGKFLEKLVVPELQSQAHEAQDRFMEETAWATQKKLPSPLAIGGLEFTRYMCNQLLRDTDVMSMAHSLEVRTPLVDIEASKCALQFLAHPFEGDGYPKWLLRQTLLHPLPDSVVKRPKQGFIFPWQEWLQGVVLKDFDRMFTEPKLWNDILRIESVQWWRDAYVRGWAHWSCFWAIYVLMKFLSASRKNIINK